ncbi:MAG: hypothetical protein R3C53_21695 [Pirellulaceae bacterium]
MLKQVSSCLLVLIACSGCSTWSKSTRQDKGKDDGWSISKLWKKEYGRPQSIVAIWSPDVLVVPGRPATRGFGGRIYFYNERSQAIPVDGDLMVHGYLQQPKQGMSPQVAADKTFGFTAEQLTTHFSPSDLGASYSVWIPWDVDGGPRQEISLIPTFKGQDGTVVQGAPAKVNLPGTVSDGGAATTPMHTVSYSSRSIATNTGAGALVQTDTEPAKTMRTTTINIPSNATLAQPKRYTGQLLAAQRTSSSLPVAGTGVSIGGGTSLGGGVSTGGGLTEDGSPANPLLSPPPARPLPNWSPSLSPTPGNSNLPALSPASNTFRSTQLKSLAPPKPAWAPRSSVVQPASFTE